MLIRKKLQPRKQIQGRLRGGPARGSSLAFGDHGLQALEPGWISSRSIDAARVAMTRYVKRGGKVWVRISPDRQVTKGASPPGERQGSGWVAVVRPGRILFEVSGVAPGIARRALQQAAAKLPVQCQIVDRETQDTEASGAQARAEPEAAAEPARPAGTAVRGNSRAMAEARLAQEPRRMAAIADYQRARRGFASDEDLAEVLGVRPTRLDAWKRGAVRPSLQNARLLSHVAVTVGELAEFLDPDVIPDWLLSEQHTLGGRAPAEALRQGQLAEVLYAANATEHGAYV